ETDAMRARWEAERTALREVQALREGLEQVRQGSQRAERDYDLNRAAPGGGGEQAGRASTVARGGDRGRDRGHCVAVDRHPGDSAAGGRAREVAAHRRGASRAGGRPGGGCSAGGG